MSASAQSSELQTASTLPCIALKFGELEGYGMAPMLKHIVYRCVVLLPRLRHTYHGRAAHAYSSAELGRRSASAQHHGVTGHRARVL